MKKGLFLMAFLALVSLGGCTTGEDFADVATQGTWRVSLYIANNDDDTGLFRGYVFTFLKDGTVTVTRPGAPQATGTWNEFNSNTRLDLDFSAPGLLERLDKGWVIDSVDDNDILLHEVGSLFTQLEFARI